jgi:hypothetical protein
VHPLDSPPALLRQLYRVPQLLLGLLQQLFHRLPLRQLLLHQQLLQSLRLELARHAFQKYRALGIQKDPLNLPIS